MKLMSTHSLSILLLIYIPDAFSTQIPLLNTNVPPASISVLQRTDENKDTLGCTTDKIKKLSDALKEAVPRAAAAAAALVKQGGVGTEGAKTWLGTIQAKDIKVLTDARYTRVAASFDGQLLQVTDRTAGNSATTVRFMCQDETTETPTIENPCTRGVFAATCNQGETSKDRKLTCPFNQIVLCPPFFTGNSFDGDRTQYVKDKGDPTKGPNGFTAPTNAAHILIHEAQHSIPLLGNAHARLDDLTRDPVPSLCSGKGPAIPTPPGSIPNKPLTDAQKPGNAENWALVSFLVKADPPRFESIPS